MGAWNKFWGKTDQKESCGGILDEGGQVISDESDVLTLQSNLLLSIS